jgi:hypothetical protein
MNQLLQEKRMKTHLFIAINQKMNYIISENGSSRRLL